MKNEGVRKRTLCSILGVRLALEVITGIIRFVAIFNDSIYTILNGIFINDSFTKKHIKSRMLKIFLKNRIIIEKMITFVPGLSLIVIMPTDI